jgi:phage repressor protein C with HTH and peptisase S24 domain
MTYAEPFVAGGKTITVQGNSMMPLYRHGDRLIVSDQAPISVGDRIVVESSTHGTLGGTLLYRDPKCIALMLGGKSRRDVLVEPEDIEYLGRIIWASQ